MSEAEMTPEEKEIITAYQDGTPMYKITKEFGLREFDVGYILAKYNVKVRPRRAFLPKTALVSTRDNSLRFPGIIVSELELKKGQLVKFDIVDAKKMIVQLTVVEPPKNDKTNKAT